jgi:hypothetical protein
MQDRAVVMGGGPDRRLLGGKQGLQPLPWCGRQVSSVHAMESTKES